MRIVLSVLGFLGAGSLALHYSGGLAGALVAGLVGVAFVETFWITQSRSNSSRTRKDSDGDVVPVVVSVGGDDGDEGDEGEYDDFGGGDFGDFDFGDFGGDFDGGGDGGFW